VTETVFDHVSIGTRVLADGWELFGGLLGGTWVYGGDSPGFWWGQVRFRTGPKIELITPTGGPDSAFLERFLDRDGPGAHHLNFMVSDIEQTLRRIRALGIEPVQVRLDDPGWKEAFLRARDAFGIVIQVAEQSGPPPELAAPAGLGSAGRQSAFTLVEHHVDNVAAAIRLFCSALDGEVVSQPDASLAELSWPNGARLRLSARAPGARAGNEPRSGSIGAAGPLHFIRDDGPFSADELSRAANLSRLLGVCVELRS
jgi:catechol 2,3-dioxygenase-like lactoylglutathione lyase family enzyme